jgi:hypothetical protein
MHYCLPLIPIVQLLLIEMNYRIRVVASVVYYDLRFNLLSFIPHCSPTPLLSRPQCRCFIVKCLPLMVGRYSCICQVIVALPSSPFIQRCGALFCCVNNIGDTKCYNEWYHILAFIVLPLIILFPFGLVYLTNGASQKGVSLRRQLTIVYRSRLIGRWGTALQMFRRGLLVIVSTFTLIPETVRFKSTHTTNHFLISYPRVASVLTRCLPS